MLRVVPKRLQLCCWAALRVSGSQRHSLASSWEAIRERLIFTSLVVVLLRKLVCTVVFLRVGYVKHCFMAETTVSQTSWWCCFFLSELRIYLVFEQAVRFLVKHLQGRELYIFSCLKTTVTYCGMSSLRNTDAG